MLKDYFLTCRYRKITDPELAPTAKDSPVMGIHLGLRSRNGVVHLGDPIYVNEETQQKRVVSPP